MNYYDIIFYFFAAVTILSAGVVVLSRNIMYSAFALMFTFFGVAGLYVLLNADFIAIAQVLIYVGGILVLMLFGVMLTNKVINVDIRGSMLSSIGLWIVGGIAGIAGGALFGALYLTDWNFIRGNPTQATTINDLGSMLMTTYILPFEVISIVLLVALVGAAFIARKEKKTMELR